MFVVAGVSGNTGSVVAETLLAKGQKVRVVVRTKDKGDRFAALGAEVAVADLADGAALTRALEGAKGVYVLVPPAVTAADVLAAQQLVIDGLDTAIRASGVAHVVALSSIGAEQSSGTGPIVITHRMEKALRAVAPNTTFVRACYFIENLGGSLGALPHGVFPTFMKGEVRVPMVATRDIGLVAAEALLEGPKGHAIIELEGPVRVSPKDAAEIVAKITGKPIALQEAPEAAIVEAFMGFGMSKSMAGLYDEMIRAFNAGKIDWAVGGASVRRGTTTVHDVMTKLLGR